MWIDVIAGAGLLGYSGGVLNAADTGNEGHAVAVVELDVGTDLSWTASVVNSWGLSWGVAPFDPGAANRGGHFRFGPGYWNSITAITIGQVKR